MGTDWLDCFDVRTNRTNLLANTLINDLVFAKSVSD